MIDYQELKRLAEAATPGKWSTSGSYVAPTRIDKGGTTYVEAWRSIAIVPADSDRRFIAAANPAAVLALIAEVEALTEKYEAARDRKNSITALQVENERLQEELEMGRDDLLIFKSAVSALGEASKKLVFCARTSGGTAGKDQGLIDACTEVEGVITIGGVAQAMVYVEGLKAEVEALRESATFKAVQSLRADCEDLRKDAERYRWLRRTESWEDAQLGERDLWIVSSREEVANTDGEHLDAAIDALMTKETK